MAYDHVYTLSVTLAGYDISSVVPHDAVRLRRGRATAGQQAQPNSLNFTMLDSPLAPQVGDPVIFRVGTPYTASAVWFTGRVTDSDGVLRHDGNAIAVTCVSAGLGNATRAVVGDEPWSSEGDSTRIGRILDLAEIPKGAMDEDVVQFLGRDVDRQNAYALISDIANQALGVLVDEADGSVSYQNNQHRNGSTFYNLPTALIPEDKAPGVSAKIGGLVNRVRLRWGPEPEEGGEQAEVLEEDAASIAAYGPSERSLTTQLFNEANARSIAQAILAAYKNARYRSDRLYIPMHQMPADVRPDLEGIVIGTGVSVPGLQPPAPNPWAAWIEGIVDTWDNGVWDRELLLDDYYSQPLDIEPPPPAEDCFNFDWSASCSVLDWIPKGEGIPLDIDFEMPGVSYSWDGQEVRVDFAPETEFLNTMGILTTGAVYFGDEPGYTHPQPWATGDPLVDMCVGANIRMDFSNMESASIREFAASTPWHDWPELLVPGNQQAYGVMEWTPGVGWPPEADARQADGGWLSWIYGDGTENPDSPNGCASIPESVLVGTGTRINTISPGRFIASVAVFCDTLPPPPDGEDGWEIFTYWKFSGPGPISLWMEQRSARSDYWHNQPDAPQMDGEAILRKARAFNERIAMHRSVVRGRK